MAGPLMYVGALGYDFPHLSMIFISILCYFTTQSLTHIVLQTAVHTNTHEYIMISENGIATWAWQCDITL